MTTPIPGTSSVVYAAIVARGGDIVVAGQASPPSGNGQIIVARYLPSGRPDRGYGSQGVFRSAFPTANAPFIANAIAQDPRTGKLVVAGGYGQGSLLVMRLTAAGRLDRTFGSHRSGFTAVVVGGVANSLVIQRDGRILLGGSNADRNGRPFVVARFTRNGALDRTFGRGGIVQSLFWNPTAASSAGVVGLAVTPDGAIIASGHIDYIGGSSGNGAGHGSAGIFRLTARGLPVKAFGSRGHAQVSFFGSNGVPRSWFPCAMTVDRSGRILVTGVGGTRQPSLLSARLTRRGALDRSYGAARNGRAVVTGVGDNSITTCGAAGTPAGQITVGAQSTLVQLLPSGRPNLRFAPRGVFKIATPQRVFMNAVATAGSRRIVVAGSAGNNIYVGRYLQLAGSPGATR